MQSSALSAPRARVATCQHAISLVAVSSQLPPNSQIYPTYRGRQPPSRSVAESSSTRSTGKFAYPALIRREYPSNPSKTHQISFNYPSLLRFSVPMKPHTRTHAHTCCSDCPRRKNGKRGMRARPGIPHATVNSAITSLGSPRITCISRRNAKSNGDARAIRASSSSGWRLTNLTFRGAPPRGQQRRISHDRPLRARSPSLPSPPPAPLRQRVDRASRGRTRFLFLFAAVSRPICAPLLSHSRFTRRGAVAPFALDSLGFATLSSRCSGAVSFAQQRPSLSPFLAT